MRIREAKRLKPGDKVDWSDPDDGLCSKTVIIKTIEITENAFCQHTITIEDTDGDVLQCRTSELSRHTPWGVSPAYECFVRLPAGAVMAFPSTAASNEGVSYVRFLSRDGGEFAYWAYTEWEENSQEVMGAICGAMLSNGKEMKYEYYQFTADCVFPADVEFTPFNTERLVKGEQQ